MPGPGAEERSSVEDLLDLAITALNGGDVGRAHDLASQVLRSDAGNLDAGQLLEADAPPTGEVRRLTVLFCDLVGSTELSARLDPEIYHSVLVQYQRLCETVIEQRYGGSIVSRRGDGVLAAFGHPEAHEDDVDRAVHSGLDILTDLRDLADAVTTRLGETVAARVAVHKGVVFLDRSTNDLYGLAVNVAARLEGLAEVGTVLVSDDVRRLLGERYELVEHEPRLVKGVDTPLASFTVLGRSSVSPIHRSSRTAMIGRALELDALRAHAAAAADDERPRGSCVTIVGEPGMGKSTLAWTLADEVTAAGRGVTLVSGDRLQQGYGLWPVKRLIEQRCGWDRAADAPARLARLRLVIAELDLEPGDVALLALLVGIGPDAGYAPVESDARRLREQVAEAANRFVAATLVAGGPGSLLLCEDHQWLDPDTRDLIAQVVRGSTPVAVVLTSRDPAGLPRGDNVVALGVSTLDERTARQLVLALGGAALPDATVHELLRRADGVPLFLEELVRSALQAPLPDPTGGIVGRSADNTVPAVLYEPLVARLQSAPNGAELAAAAAVLAQDADRVTLGRITGLEPEALNDALLSLLDAGVFERGVSGYRFRHELLRAVCYDLQPSSRRRELHGRAGDALRAATPDRIGLDWPSIASHYEAADRPLDAADAFERAADAAQARGGLAEAQGLLGRAVDLLAHRGQHADREAELRLRRGFLSISLEGNSSAQAASDYERCLEQALAAPGSDLMYSTLNALWSYYSSRGDLDRAHQLLTTLAGTNGPRSTAAQFVSLAGLAMVAGYQGQQQESLLKAEAAVATLATLTGAEEYAPWWFVPLDPGASCHSNLGIARLITGDVAGAEAQFREARELSRSLAFPQGPFSLAGVLTIETFARTELGQLDACDHIITEVEEISTRYGFDQWAIVAATQREVVGGLRLIGVDDDTARQALSHRAYTIGGYLSMWKMVEQWVFVTYYTTIQGTLHAAAGDVELATSTFGESLAIADRTGMRFYDAETRRHLALLRDEPAHKELGLREALALAVEQGSKLYELRAAMDLHEVSGDLEPLRRALHGVPEDTGHPGFVAARALVRET